MTHLGDLASALADGELAGLDDHERARALAHLARCATCQADVAAQRRVKARLRAEPPPVPGQLLETLSAIPATASGPVTAPAAGPQSVASVPLPGAAGKLGRRPRGRDDSRGPGRRPAGVRARYVAAAGLAASVMVGLGGAALAGGAGGAATRTTPTATPSAQTVSVVSSPPVNGTRVVAPASARSALFVGFRRP